MIDLQFFFEDFPIPVDPANANKPWQITNNLKPNLEHIVSGLGGNFNINEGIAVHKTAKIEAGVTLNRPLIISEGCIIKANAYFREGVYLASHVSIGPGCEIKSSIICENSAIAHFNYIGNSIIGKNVNFEAGAIAANHYNERKNKVINVSYNGNIIETQVTKFGALVGDGSKIGANAVLSPGTLLAKNTVVKRLALVDQFEV